MAESKKRKVELAYPRQIDGKNHRADTTVSLDEHEARALVRSGLARVPGAEPATTVAAATTTVKDGI